MPWYATVGLGLGGSLLGGVIARVLIGTAGGLIFAFLGAVLLLYLYPALRSGPRDDRALRSSGSVASYRKSAIFST